MSKKNSHASLISGRILAKNTVWNLLGSGLPLLAIPNCLLSTVCFRSHRHRHHWVAWLSRESSGSGKRLSTLMQRGLHRGLKGEIGESFEDHEERIVRLEGEGCREIWEVSPIYRSELDREKLCAELKTIPA